MPNLKKLEEIAYALEPRFRERRQFHLACIFLRGKMLSIASNSEKTHPATKQYAYHPGAVKLHAELRAMLKLGERDDYHKLEIAVLRIDMNNQLNESCPCAGCSHMIQTIGFKRVFYTNNEGLWLQTTPAGLTPRGHKLNMPLRIVA